jgi:hypothetical protein
MPGWATIAARRAFVHPCGPKQWARPPAIPARTVARSVFSCHIPLQPGSRSGAHQPRPSAQEQMDRHPAATPCCRPTLVPVKAAPDPPLRPVAFDPFSAVIRSPTAWAVPPPGVVHVMCMALSSGKDFPWPAVCCRDTGGWSARVLFCSNAGGCWYCMVLATVRGRRRRGEGTGRGADLRAGRCYVYCSCHFSAGAFEWPRGCNDEGASEWQAREGGAHSPRIPPYRGIRGPLAWVLECRPTVECVCIDRLYLESAGFYKLICPVAQRRHPK